MSMTWKQLADAIVNMTPEQKSMVISISPEGERDSLDAVRVIIVDSCPCLIAQKQTCDYEPDDDDNDREYEMLKKMGR